MVYSQRGKRSATHSTAEDIFTKLDENGDGFLTVRELQAGKRKAVDFAEFPKDMDTNGESKCSQLDYTKIDCQIDYDKMRV